MRKRYVKITNKLYLVEQEITKTTEVVKEPEPTNHIWIYDRSYSMTYNLPKLATDLINLTVSLREVKVNF